MNRSQLDELNRSLVDRGYSRRYIKRLLAELEDHAHCAAVQPAESSTESERGDRLGTVGEIVDAVEQYVELAPLVQRFPWMAFAVLPSIFLCVGTVFFSLSMEQLASWADESFSDSLKRTTPAIGFILNLGVSTGLAFIACWIGWHYRLRTLYPVIATMVIGIGAFLTTDIVYCRFTRSISCFHRWQFDTTKFVCLTTVLICFLGLTLLQRAADKPSKLLG